MSAIIETCLAFVMRELETLQGLELYGEHTHSHIRGLRIFGCKILVVTSHICPDSNQHAKDLACLHDPVEGRYYDIFCHY